ncbi:MAG: hypothetical protein IJE78_11470 [Bacteroidaceae bacterium]|nr:hypothetical protein [Bacteroidaceae bacterium]
MLKDNQTGNRLAQLKIQNIDRRTIVYIKLRFALLDASERLIREYYHTFSDITITEKDYFGSRTPVVFPEAGVCSYTVSIVEVKFNAGPEWMSNSVWTTLDKNADVDVLKKERDIRVQELIAKDAREQAIAAAIREKEEAEAEAAKEREEAKRIAIENQKKAAQRKKSIKIISIAAIILIVIVVGVIIWRGTPQYMVKKVINHIEQGDFGAASILLRESDYELTEKDIRSADKSAVYQYAEYWAERSFAEAIAIYKLIPDYSDSLDVANEMQAMLDKYVGEYECISSKTVRANGDTEVEELESNLSIYDLRYSTVDAGGINMISSDDGFKYWGFSKQNENESILEFYTEGNGCTIGFEFSPDGKKLAYTFHNENSSKFEDNSWTTETVWQKIS